MPVYLAALVLCLLVGLGVIGCENVVLTRLAGDMSCKEASKPPDLKVTAQH